MPGHLSEGDERAPGEDRFEVQVIPQDDNWGDNTTAITGMYNIIRAKKDGRTKAINSPRAERDLKSRSYHRTITGPIIQHVNKN